MEPEEQTCDCGAVVTKEYWDCYCYFALPEELQEARQKLIKELDEEIF